MHSAFKRLLSGAILVDSLELTLSMDEGQQLHVSGKLHPAECGRLHPRALIQVSARELVQHLERASLGVCGATLDA